MINLQETKIGDLVWYEESGQHFLAEIKEINTYSSKVDIDLHECSDYLLGHNSRRRSLVESKNLSKTENIDSIAKAASDYSRETTHQVEKIHETRGKSMDDSTSVYISAAATQAYLTMMRKQDRLA